jgi:hypothetical protein
VTSLPSSGSFVFDENLPHQIASALQLLDDSTVVRYLGAFFPDGTDDVVFLPVLGSAGAFLVTRDARQRRKPAELQAYREHGIGAFILGGKNLQRWDIVKQIVCAWPLIKDAAAKSRRPFAYRVPANGGRLEPLSL